MRTLYTTQTLSLETMRTLYTAEVVRLSASLAGLEQSKSIRTTFYKGTNVQGGECLDSLKAAEETDDSTRQMQQASSPSVLAMPAESILNQRSYNYTLLLLLATCN